MDNPRRSTAGSGSISRKPMHDQSIAAGGADTRNRVRRIHVMNAFRAMARGVSAPAAWTRTLSFYRTASPTWARQLG